MSNMPNQPIPGDPDYPPSQGAFPVWSKVYTKPGEQTFVEITSHPEAKARAAYIWVFLAGTLSGLINSLTQFAVALIVLRQTTPELGELPAGAGGVFGAVGLLGAICAAPVTGVFSVLGFAASVGIVHATARFFGGKGTFDKLAYAFGAVTVPISVVSALLIPLNAVPYVLFCTAPLLLVLGIYALYLEVAAVKAVHQCGWGEAAAAFFMPTILLLMVCGVLFLVLMNAVGPSINEIMQELQRTAP